MTPHAKNMIRHDKISSPPPGPTIAAGYPKALLVFAVSKGADRQTLLAPCRLTSAELADPESRIPLERYLALIDAAIELTGDPALALHFGEAVRMQDICIVGLVCEVAETTAEVARQLNRYASLMIDERDGNPGEIVRGVAADGGIWMEIVGPSWCAHPKLMEAELTRLVCNTRATFGPVPEFQSMRFPLAAEFTFPEPAYRAEYERIFQAPLKFGGTRNGLLLEPAFGLLRQPPAERYAFGVLSERADALLAALKRETTLRAKVERTLMSILHTGDASMDLVADKLGMGRRTLLRRLKEEGTTFERVLDDLRRTLALDYLAGKKVSVNECAYLVGFSDPAAFSRAFKRWTGMSPGEARRKSD